ncbi:MAG: saccharopine dehydrogenase NADP-binding domain-containing protein [Gammaproteobacteria bacterium]|nr:saccharopine dehydrogenase NADP-binding domain-containing protein [Gammaproteobacteria bacterium]
MNILVAGAGQIGSLLAQLLAAGGYKVHLVDSNPDHFSKLSALPNLTTIAMNVVPSADLEAYIKNNAIEALVACLPYYCNFSIAQLAAICNCHYFDLTEDVKTVSAVQELAQGKSQAFVSRCGVAPGYINILAHHLMQNFESLDSVKLRAGCLPQHATNSLHYALAWSIDGLINEYGNMCPALVDGKKTYLQPLEDLEVVELDGVMYEAFNTSGGIGGLHDRYEGKVSSLNYKSMRYPGHADRMKFLMQDLKLNDDREVLKKILLRALPKTDSDVMIIYVSVSGMREGEFFEENTLKKIYPKTLFDKRHSAIQVATASSAATVIDLVLSNKKCYQGFVYQEDIKLDQFMASSFALPYKDLV